MAEFVYTMLGSAPHIMWTCIGKGWDERGVWPCIESVRIAQIACSFLASWNSSRHILKLEGTIVFCSIIHLEHILSIYRSRIRLSHVPPYTTYIALKGRARWPARRPGIITYPFPCREFLQRNSSFKGVTPDSIRPIEWKTGGGICTAWTRELGKECNY